jgi:hypothetical protein
MKTYSFVICIIFLSLICGFGNALMQYQNDSQLILTSDQIVYGKIVDVKSQWNAQKTHIETTAQILVADAFKKSDTSISSGSTVTVTVLGGTVGDVTEWVEDMPVFIPGTDAFVYLNKRIGGTYSVNGLYQGVHTVNNNKLGKSTTKYSSSASDVEKFKERINKTLQGTPTDAESTGIFDTSSDSLDAPGPIVYAATVTTVSPNTSSAGTNTIITITGSGFGTKASRESLADVAFLYRTDGEDPFIYASGWPYFSDNANDIVSWTDTQIKVKVPTGYTSDGYPGSASSGFLGVLTDSEETSAWVRFTVTFGYGKAKWNKTATYYVNPDSVSGAATAVQNAATTWNNAIPGSTFRLNYGGLSTCTTFGKDGKSLIYFGPASDFLDPDIIAWATHWSSGGFITEADIEFNTNWTWTTGTASGSTMNVEAIVLHEQGHWLALRDLYGFLPEAGLPGWPSDISPEKKVMFGYNNNGFGNKNLKTLSSADVAGIRWIYPPGSGPTVTSITPSSGLNTGSVSITNLAGTKFVNGATVRLTRSGYNNISATGVTVISPTKITCTLPITGKEPGQWNVVVINPDGQAGTITNGFRVTAVTNATAIGVFRPSTHLFYLDYNGNGVWNVPPADRQYNFGISGDIPVSGDWDNNGKSEIGVFRNSTHLFYLDYNGNGVWNVPPADRQYNFGISGDLPVTGDWNNDSKSEIGVFRPSTHLFYLDYNGNGVWNVPPADRQYNFGISGDIPISGDWNNDRISEIGVFRPSTHLFYLDYNGNGVWNVPPADRQYNFDISGDKPVSGKWG